MKVEFRKVYKDLYVGGESHKIGDKVLTLPEHNTETEVAVGTDMGVFMVDLSYFKNDLKKEWTAADNGEVEELINVLKFIGKEKMISYENDIKWLKSLKYRFDKDEYNEI